MIKHEHKPITAEPERKSKPHDEAERIFDGMVSFGTHDNTLTRPVPAPAAPDSEYSRAQDTVMRGIERTWYEAHYAWVSSLLVHAKRDTHTVQCLTALLFMDRPVSTDPDDQPVMQSAFRGHSESRRLRLQDGYEPYVTGKDYPWNTHMALYEKGTGKFIFGGTRSQINNFVFKHGPKRAKEIKKNLRIEVKVA